MYVTDKTRQAVLSAGTATIVKLYPSVLPSALEVDDCYDCHEKENCF